MSLVNHSTPNEVINNTSSQGILKVVISDNDPKLPSDSYAKDTSPQSPPLAGNGEETEGIKGTLGEDRRPVLGSAGISFNSLKWVVHPHIF